VKSESTAKVTPWARRRGTGRDVQPCLRCIVDKTDQRFDSLPSGRIFLSCRSPRTGTIDINNHVFVTCELGSITIMPWTTPQSPPQDVALDNAWDTLNQVLDRRVRVSTQMRLTSCVSDILSFVTLLRQLETAEIRRSEVLDERLAEWQASDHQRAPTHHWESHFSLQFAAALKAEFYFIRALQDATYAALLEAGGNRPGRYSSMHDCAKNPANPLRPLIDAALPEYFVWFADLRALRNVMKLGASTSFEFRGATGARSMYVRLQVVDDTRRHVSSGRELSIADVENSLSHSAQLLDWAAAYVRQRPNSRLQQSGS
jgi:hypothetical protein